MTRTDDCTIAETFRRLVPDEVAVSVWEGTAEPPLLPVEVRFLASATPKRQLEFRRGRACARHALSLLGVPPCPIPVGPGSAPVWPRGFLGSITHCADLVVAVAAPTRTISALGIDAEPARALPNGVRRRVLHPLDSLPEDDPLFETVVFSAKETIHKALFPSSGVWMDFLDVVVRIDPTGGRFSAIAAPGAGAAAPRLAELRGHFAITHGFVLTAASIVTDHLLFRDS